MMIGPLPGLKLLLIILGLGLWLAPFNGPWAPKLNEVGKWTFIIALAAYLWLR